MKKNVTAKDIARICGVSQATVSYVINNRTNQKISEETRRKVLEAVEALHYYPNASARNMRTKNCTTIGIVCARDYSRQAFLNAMTGISRYLSRLDYTIAVYNEEDMPEAENESPQYVKSYFSNLIDGLIYISNRDHGSFIEPALINRIPYVVLCMDGVFSQKSPTPHAFDTALRDCARFCQKRGFREIRYFSIDNDGLFVNNKYPVFQSALKELAPDCRLKHVICPAKQREFSEMQRFFAAYMELHTFDLAISQNYDIGLLLQREILRKDFSIPQKIRNLFLNDVNFYEMTYPSITGISVPYDAMGEYAAQLITRIIDGTEEHFPYREFQCRLLERESTL